MTARYFEGPAGSGKTTRIFDALMDSLGAQPLQQPARVLALTKMHGSRRRLQGRLKSLTGLAGNYDCVTLDSFAWNLVMRWRGLAKMKFGWDGLDSSYDTISQLAASLLAEPFIQTWVSCRYTIILVDEMQDCSPVQTSIIGELSKSSDCYLAADEFQDLNGTGNNPAVEWARVNSTVTQLAQIHRTNVAGLLTAAQQLRDGVGVSTQGTDFKVLGALNKNVGASFVSNNLSWWGNKGQTAVLSPVRPEGSPFVRELLERVASGPIGQKQAGPYMISWEENEAAEQEVFISTLKLPDGDEDPCSWQDLDIDEGSPHHTTLKIWFERQSSLTGKEVFTKREILTAIERIFHHQRSHGWKREASRVAMTIHQAKNREFDNVIVLWPYQAPNDIQAARRLLYNAITRAKRRATVIVQNPTRISAPLFDPTPAGN